MRTGLGGWLKGVLRRVPRTCPHCHQLVLVPLDAKYCPFCGKKMPRA